MSSNRRPWYPWYPKDFVVDEKVQGLSPIAELVYRRALDVMWQANALQLPNHLLKLCNQLGKGLPEKSFKDAWNEIQFPGFELFKISDDGNWIYSKRLIDEATKIEKISKIRKKAGEKGGKQLQSICKANAKANKEQLQSHTDTDTYTDLKDTPYIPQQGELFEVQKTDDSLFEKFWSLYPKKKNKGTAKKSWKKIKNKSETLDLILSALEWQKKSKDWKKDAGQFIPYPSTYLNGEGWLDEKQYNNKPEQKTQEQINREKFNRAF